LKLPPGATAETVDFVTKGEIDFAPLFARFQGGNL